MFRSEASHVPKAYILGTRICADLSLRPTGEELKKILLLACCYQEACARSWSRAFPHPRGLPPRVISSCLSPRAEGVVPDVAPEPRNGTTGPSRPRRARPQPTVREGRPFPLGRAEQQERRGIWASTTGASKDHRPAAPRSPTILGMFLAIRVLVNT